MVGLLDDAGWWSAGTPIQHVLMAVGVLDLKVLVIPIAGRVRNVPAPV
jgi:hypothetical protein